MRVPPDGASAAAGDVAAVELSGVRLTAVRADCPRAAGEAAPACAVLRFVAGVRVTAARLPGFGEAPPAVGCRTADRVAPVAVAGDSSRDAGETWDGAVAAADRVDPCDGAAGVRATAEGVRPRG